MAAYDADGKLKLTASPGSGRVGLYAPDGSIYYTTSPGSGRVGSMAPDGSIYITDATGSAFSSVYAPDGSIRVTSANEYNGAWRVSGISSVVASWNASTSTLAMLTAIVNHTRTSLATMFDSTGKLTYCPNNLLLNTATLGTQTVTVQIGVSYILSIKGTGSVTLTGASTAGPLNGTGASNRVDLKITASTSSLTLTVAGSVTSARLSAVTYETAFRSQDDVDNTASAYYGPRIDYDPNTLAVKGLLIEEARTNLAIQSGNFASGWTFTAATRSTDGTLAPDAATAAAKITLAASSASHEFYNTAAITTTSSATYTGSIFVKKGNYRYVSLTIENTFSTGAIAVFDLDAPTAATQTWAVGTGAYTSSSITNEGNGWYRLTITGVPGAGTTSYLIPGFVQAATGNPTSSVEPSWPSAGTEYGYFFGAQLEPGSFATSYIPTAASSVTRAADVVQFTGAALTALNSTTYSALVEMTDEVSGAAAYIIAPTATNLPIMYTGASTNVAPVYSYNGVGTINTANITWSSANRLGFATSPAGRSLVANGGTVVSDAASPGALGASVSLFNGLSSTRPANGHVKSFAIYNQRLPDATLQAKSVVGASYAANNNGVRFAFANDNLPVHWRIAL